MSIAPRRRATLSALAVSLSLAFGALAPALAQDAPTPTLAPPANAAEAALRDLYTAEWDWRQAEFDRVRVDGRWQAGERMPSVTPEAWARRAAYWKAVLAKLDAIPLDALGREERITPPRSPSILRLASMPDSSLLKCTPMPWALLFCAPGGVIQATVPAIGRRVGSSMSDKSMKTSSPRV